MGGGVRGWGEKGEWKRGCTRNMHGRTCPYNPGTEHVGVSRTRQALLVGGGGARGRGRGISSAEGTWLINLCGDHNFTW